MPYIIIERLKLISLLMEIIRADWTKPKHKARFLLLICKELEEIYNNILIEPKEIDIIKGIKNDIKTFLKLSKKEPRW